MGLAIRKPIPDTHNTCVDMTKPRNALQKSLALDTTPHTRDWRTDRRTYLL